MFLVAINVKYTFVSYLYFRDYVCILMFLLIVYGCIVTFFGSNCYSLTLFLFQIAGYFVFGVYYGIIRFSGQSAFVFPLKVIAQTISMPSEAADCLLLSAIQTELAM